MKMNNKGFTVVELLASFTLTMVISVLLFEIVLELKDTYINTALKTRVIDQNNVVATTLNRNFLNKGINAASCSGNSCTVTYDDGSTDNISVSGSGVKIGSKTISMPTTPSSTSIKNVSLKVATTTPATANPNLDNSYIKISYDVSGAILDKDVSFNYIYTFH